VPDERAPQLFAATLETLPGVGHWVPIVAAARVAEHVARASA